MGDGIDQSCDPIDGTDADGDSYASVASGGTDCDDGEPTTYLGAEDAWYDGVDSDCAGNDDYDQDGDGQSAVVHGGTDCYDLSAYHFLGQTTYFYNSFGSSFDANCDGLLERNVGSGVARCSCPFNSVSPGVVSPVGATITSGWVVDHVYVAVPNCGEVAPYVSDPSHCWSRGGSGWVCNPLGDNMSAPLRMVGCR